MKNFTLRKSIINGFLTLIIGFVVSNAGIKPSVNWEYWAMTGLIIAIIINTGID